MARQYRLDPPHNIDPRRLLVGVSVSSACKEMSVALVEADQFENRPGILAARTAKIPEEIAGHYTQLATSASWPAGALIAIRQQVTDLEATLIGELLGQASLADGGVLAVGVHDPGLWSFAHGSSKPAGYLGLCDPARLAVATGLSIIDAFPDRDLAQGGQGGPLTAVAEWMLLGDPVQSQILLDLGQTARMTFLPAGKTVNSLSRLRSFEVGPGTRLLDVLAQRLTNGQQRFDPGGCLAVQGRRISELVEHWLRDPIFERPSPCWHPRGLRAERFLAEAMQMAVAAGWSIRDLLCTATHLIAEVVVLAIRKRFQDDGESLRIVVTGGGQHNGLLLRVIGERLPDVPLIRVSDLGIPSEAFGPTLVGLLAALHLDQMPAATAAITGAEISCVLGRLTPGSPQNWRSLLRSMTAPRTTLRALREAV